MLVYTSHDDFGDKITPSCPEDALWAKPMCLTIRPVAKVEKPFLWNPIWCYLWIWFAHAWVTPSERAMNRKWNKQGEDAVGTEVYLGQCMSKIGTHFAVKFSRSEDLGHLDWRHGIKANTFPSLPSPIHPQLKIINPLKWFGPACSSLVCPHPGFVCVWPCRSWLESYFGWSAGGGCGGGDRPSGHRSWSWLMQL